MVENRCGTECKAAGPVYFDQERKKAKTVLSGAVGSCMETSLKYVLRKVGGGYPLNRFFLEVEYVLFIWYLESYTHSIIYPLLN